jgi:hypothetical protein
LHVCVCVCGEYDSLSVCAEWQSVGAPFRGRTRCWYRGRSRHSTSWGHGDTCRQSTNHLQRAEGGCRRACVDVVVWGWSVRGVCGRGRWCCSDKGVVGGGVGMVAWTRCRAATVWVLERDCTGRGGMGDDANVANDGEYSSYVSSLFGSMVGCPSNVIRILCNMSSISDNNANVVPLLGSENKTGPVHMLSSSQVLGTWMHLGPSGRSTHMSCSALRVQCTDSPLSKHMRIAGAGDLLLVW